MADAAANGLGAEAGTGLNRAGRCGRNLTSRCSKNRSPCLQSGRSEDPGLELPIDHFRLLGVSPTTDGQTVLRTLQQRLDRAPDQGFTHDTLQARAELLRSSAELLSDDERRQQYERELTTIADSDAAAVAGLEIPPSREVGGLLLLMEAGQAQEAFDAASRGLQPPQAPALGSSREADLTLLAGLACHSAACDYRNQRHYETAARTLQQGLQLLQRMGQLPEQRRRLEQELQALQPYRVLDLTDGRAELTGFVLAGLGADVVKISPDRPVAARASLMNARSSSGPGSLSE